MFSVALTALLELLPIPALTMALVAFEESGPVQESERRDEDKTNWIHKESIKQDKCKCTQM